MKVQERFIAKLKVLLSAAAAIVGMAIVFLYLGSSTREPSIITSFYILLVCFIALLVSLNFIYFHLKMSKAHPKVARALPMCFVLTCMLYFWVHEFLLQHALDPRSVVLFALLSLGAWLMLNVGVYLFIE